MSISVYVSECSFLVLVKEIIIKNANNKEVNDRSIRFFSVYASSDNNVWRRIAGGSPSIPENKAVRIK